MAYHYVPSEVEFVELLLAIEFRATPGGSETGPTRIFHITQSTAMPQH